MQSDFHHAAQYVDDATTSGFIRFSNGMRYQRTATAHAMCDPGNLDDDDNTVSWTAAAEYFGVKVPIEAGDHVRFLDSHYRHFHDAARAQRQEVLQVILPAFGIVAA